MSGPALAPETLASRSPRVGETLLVSGARYEITDHSTYNRDDGQSVSEWCCETDEIEAYLLRERDAQGQTRWFFTRWVESSQLSLQGGGRLPRDLPSGAPAQPAAKLLCGAQIYSHTDTTDGVYEDEPGRPQRKVTLEFWNEDHSRNVAIELWPNGEFDCYRGSYVDGSQVRIVAAAPLRFPWPDGLPSSAGAAGAAAYLFSMIFFGWPFDQCLALSLLAAAAAGAWRCEASPAAKSAALLLAAGSGLGLAWRPPFGSPLGLAILLAAPALTAVFFRSDPARGLSWLCALCGFAPAAALGFYHYFAFAPGPRELGQLLIALAPAAAATAAGWIAGRLLGADGLEAHG